MCGKSWKDYRMTWNASEFGGLEHVYVSTADLWTPDASLHNKSVGFDLVSDSPSNAYMKLLANS